MGLLGIKRVQNKYICTKFCKKNSEIMREELEKKVARAIKLIQSASKIAAENGCPQIEVAYSGGKDSDVILELTKMSGVPYRAIYKNTTIDPAGTIKHAQDMGAEVIRPKHSFLELLSMNGYPNMFYRHCCSQLKEYKVLDYAIVGIRRSESVRRAKRYKEPEQCRVYSKTQKVRQYMPILDWDDSDVQEFIEAMGVKCAPVYYDENNNFHVERRLGCMGCPLASTKKRIEEFKKHPNIVKLYVRGGGIIYGITQKIFAQRNTTKPMNGFVVSCFAKTTKSSNKTLVATTCLATR